MILTSHTDVSQFRGFRWRLTDGVHVFLSSSRPSPTQRPVGALIINCIAKKIKNKNPHHSSLKLFKGGPSWETCIHPPPPPTRLLLLHSACKNKNREQITTAELRMSCSRTQSDASGGFHKSAFVHFHLYRCRAERRHWLLSTRTNHVAPFFLQNVKTSQLVAGNNSIQTIWLFFKQKKKKNNPKIISKSWEQLEFLTQQFQRWDWWFLAEAAGFTRSRDLLNPSRRASGSGVEPTVSGYRFSFNVTTGERSKKLLKRLA